MKILVDELLVTTDKGFVRFRGQQHSGILVVRLRQPNRERIHQRVLQALARLPDQTHWENTTVVMRDRMQSTWRASGET